MKASKLKELLDTKDYQRIIGLYTNSKIDLTEKQLDKVLRLKRESEAVLWKRERKQVRY